MNTLIVPFKSKLKRDLAFSFLEALNYKALDKSEPKGAGIRPLPGEDVNGLKFGNKKIVFTGEHLPQWSHAIAACLAWRLGVFHQDTHWKELYLNNNLLLVASTSKDVRGSRGLLEVDKDGRLLSWREGEDKKNGPLLMLQNSSLEVLVQLINSHEAQNKMCKKRGRPPKKLKIEDLIDT